MKKFAAKVFAFVLAAVMVMSLATSCTLKKSPMERIEDAINNSITAVAENAAAEAVQKVYEGGSMELNMEVGPLLAMALGAADANFSLGASLKMYTDLLNGKSAFAASVSSDGVSIADVLLAVADKSVSVSSNALFGNDVYGFSTENFAEKFDNSEFGMNGALSLGITAEEIGMLLGSFTEYTETAVEMQKYEKELEDARDDLTADLYPLIESHGTIETVAGTLDVGGNSVKTDDIVFTYTGEQLAALFTDVLTLLRDHESVRSAFEILSEYITAYYTEDMLASMDLDPAVFNVDDILAEYTAQIDALLEEMDSLKEESADVNFVLAVHISKSAEEVIGFSLDMDEEEDHADVRFVCGPSALDIDEISFSVNVKTTEEDYEMSAAYVVTEDTADTYAAKLYMNEDGMETDIFSIEWDKKDGDYSLAVEAEGQSVGLGGKYVEEKDSLTVTLNTVSAGGVSINFGEIAMIFRANDPVPTNGAYVDILEMDAEELETVVMDVVTAVQELIYAFIG